MRFSERADEYVERAFVQRDLVEWGSQWLPDSLTGSQVLELGAGPGILTPKLLERGADLLATDLAPGMVEAGGQRYPQARWQQMDAWEPTGSFDFIASSALMQWASDAQEVLAQQASVLRAGGRMLHLLFVDPTLGEFRQLAPDWSPMAWRSANEWQRAFYAAGLRVKRAETVEHRVVFPDARALLRFFQRTGAVGTRRVAAGELRTFIRAYDRRFSGSDGVYSTWAFLRIEAQKV